MSKVSGTGPGQRQLNGPQTTGREYRNLSEPAHGMRSDQDVAAVIRNASNCSPTCTDRTLTAGSRR